MHGLIKFLNMKPLLVLCVSTCFFACSKKSEYPKKMMVGESRKVLPATKDVLKKDSEWKHLRMRFHTGSDYLNFNRDSCKLQFFFEAESKTLLRYGSSPKIFNCEEFKSIFSACKYILPRSASIDPERDFLFCDRQIDPEDIERIKIQYNDKAEKEITSLSGELYEEESQILSYDLLLSYSP